MEGRVVICVCFIEIFLGFFFIVIVVNVSNRNFLNIECFMCIKLNGCFNFLVSDCSWVLYCIIYCVNFVVSMIRKEYINYVVDWIVESVNLRDFDVKFKILFVINLIIG